MADLNKVILAGRLTRDPELRYIASGTALASLSLAVSRTYQGKDGSKKEEVAFINIDVWGKQAEACGEYLSKGSSIFVEGRLQLDKWDDKKTGEKRSQLKVVAQSVQFLSTKKKGDKPAPAAGAAEEGVATDTPEDVPLDEDIPF
jgi:single-strand DNA-binding protein